VPIRPGMYVGFFFVSSIVRIEPVESQKISSSALVKRGGRCCGFVWF
jgi:hypothetical protein